MKRDIFSIRKNYKPFEYPQLLKFVDSINKSFWVHSEVDFTADIQDFHSNLNDHEKQTVKRALLVISQTEVDVKSFWGNLYNHLPKPEINGLGATFSESEYRHSEAYSRLAEVLGYNNEFEELIKVPAIAERLRVLEIARKNKINYSFTTQEYRINFALQLIIFSTLIENVSLFTQFATVLSFTRHQGLMKNVSNIIAWTSVDEQLHAKAGIELVRIILQENPEYREVLLRELKRLLPDLIKMESDVVDWIYDNKDLEKVKIQDLKNYICRRTDESLVEMGFEPIYHTPIVKELNWFEEEIHSNTLDDFFAKRPVDYTKHDKSISGSDLF